MATKAGGPGLAAVGLLALGALLALTGQDSAATAPRSRGGRRRSSPQPEGPAAGPRTAPRPGGAQTVAQPAIIDAVWAVLAHGNDGAIESIRLALSTLTPELQCYVAAAADSARQEFLTWTQSIKDFENTAKRIQQDINERQNKENLAIGTAGLVVNAIPYAGQILSLGIAVGLAIKKIAVSDSEVKDLWKKRLSDPDFLKDWEGSDAWKGLRIEGNRYPGENALRLRVDGDLIASRLPVVKFGTKYFFTPTIEKYRAVAKKIGLYSRDYITAAYGFADTWNGPADWDYPVSALDIRAYAMGYSLGMAHTESDRKDAWFLIGYRDAAQGTASRVGVDLQVWANQFLGDE